MYTVYDFFHILILVSAVNTDLQEKNMENATVNGAETQIVEEKKVDSAPADVVSKTDLQAILEKQNKEWQSRFDKLLTEKKEVVGKALTTEQRLEAIEQERQEERLTWSRKEAKAKAQIDDELETAILDYSSKDPERIHNGATNIRSIFDKLVATNKELAVKLALEKVGSQPAPKGGNNGSPAKSLKEFNKMTAKDQAAFMASGGSLINEGE